MGILIGRKFKKVQCFEVFLNDRNTFPPKLPTLLCRSSFFSVASLMVNFVLQNWVTADEHGLLIKTICCNFEQLVLLPELINIPLQIQLPIITKIEFFSKAIFMIQTDFFSFFKSNIVGYFIFFKFFKKHYVLEKGLYDYSNG